MNPDPKTDPLGPFLLRCAAFAALSLGVWAACTALFFRGYTDDYYERVASPRQAALILGTSRAAQGLVPAEIASRELGVESPLYNFAFASSISRYGEAYFEAIKKKLSEPRPGQSGLFLLEVSPLAISTSKGASERFPERDSFIGQLHTFSTHPNIEYPFYQPDRGYTIIDRIVRHWRNRDRLIVHDDGWLEVTPAEVERVEDNIEAKLADYTRTMQTSELSATRLSYLERTLELLAPRGRTALVVLPIHPRLRALERSYMPDFDARLRAVAERWRASYLDLSDLDGLVMTNDGNHLHRDSARRVSRELSVRLAAASERTLRGRAGELGGGATR